MNHEYHSLTLTQPMTFKYFDFCILIPIEKKGSTKNLDFCF